MGTGYYLAITTEDPMSAVALFFLAVVLVIIGTYCLFTAGSIVLLKLLRKNKAYYYQTKHFTLVSGMLFRMKQNAVGLGNICILSTMVLVTLSSTIALYVGTEDTLRNQYPYMLAVYSEEDGYRVVDEQALTRQLLDAAAEAGCKVTNYQTVRYLEEKHWGCGKVRLRSGLEAMQSRRWKTICPFWGSNLTWRCG